MPDPELYVELRARSAFSFLDGSSLPAELIQRASALGYRSLALCDRDGVYGAPQFYQAATRAGIQAIVGAELQIVPEACHLPGASRAHDLREPTPRRGAPPSGDLDRALNAPSLPGTTGRIAVLATDRQAYQGLCRLLTLAKARISKLEAVEHGAPLSLGELSAHARGLIALMPPDTPDALAAGLREAFAAGDLFFELRRHRQREDGPRNRRALELARRLGIGTVATNDVRYAAADRADLHDVLTCIRHKRTLEEARELLPRHAEQVLKAPAQMARIFADIPEAVARTLAIAERCTFSLAHLGYRFPDYPLPPGQTADSMLAELVAEGLPRRYPASAGSLSSPATHAASPAVLAQLDHELALIARLGMAGYFLIVWDIVRFCRERHIMVQGRGSAANSAVCYVIGITAVDPVARGLLFERFLSEDRGEWPDIDLDLPSGDLREEVIQYVYRRYGAGAAMTANVITYRGRSAVRDVGKVLGIPQENLDRLSSGGFPHDAGDRRAPSETRLPGGSGPTGTRRELLPGSLHAHDTPVQGESRPEARLAEAGLDPASPRVQRFLDLVGQIQHLPRHLGQHSGGMVVCQGRLDDLVPVEPATMPGRSVITWDKDDCADLGILKIDLLGLGMMGVLQDAVPLVREAEGIEIDYARLPDDDSTVWDMLCRADTVGVFQLESRAQMNILPRLRPRCFYDVVVSIGLIRPGPIVGKMVSPYLQRRAGLARPTYPHPDLEPVLRRTLGVPIFQEQVMRMAMVMAGFSGAQAEQLRRAMGFKRSDERMSDIERQLQEGMARRGVSGAVADEVVNHITSFAQYGFPEAHSCSFALLAFATAYLKAHHPEALLCGLLNHFPMGFYHPATLIRDAQRHGIEVRSIDATVSSWDCTLETAVDATLSPDTGPVDARSREAKSPLAPRPAVRLGLRYVQGLGEAAGRHLVASRQRAPFADIGDLMRRTRLRTDEVERLATIGALSALGGGPQDRASGSRSRLSGRREALWQVQGLADYRRGLLAGAEPEDDPFELEEMTPVEALVADYRGTTVSTSTHPMAILRPMLDRRGIVTASGLDGIPAGATVTIAGTVIVRNRPPTARGMTFLSLEDETGLINVVIEPQCYERYRVPIVTSGALVLSGRLERRQGVTSIRIQHVEPLAGPGLLVASRDFH